MRKRVWIPLALISAAAIGFFGVAPGYVEGAMNQVDGKPLIKGQRRSQGAAQDAVDCRPAQRYADVESRSQRPRFAWAHGPPPPARGQCRAPAFLVGQQNAQEPELRRQWCGQRQYHFAHHRAVAADEDLELACGALALPRAKAGCGGCRIRTCPAGGGYSCATRQFAGFARQGPPSSGRDADDRRPAKSRGQGRQSRPPLCRRVPHGGPHAFLR